MSQGRNRIQMVRHGIDGAVNLARRRAWFADESAQQSGGDSSAAAQPDASAEVPDWAKDPKRAMEIVKELREENAKTRTSARDLEKRLEAIEKARQAADEQTLVEQNRWKEIAEKRDAELKQLQETLQKSQQQALRTQIAVEFGLPAPLAARLQGATEEELRADAEQLKALVPQAPGAQQNRNTTQAVPGGQPAAETDAQRRTRLNGSSGNVLGQGGGVRLPRDK
jgi:vacuolar-type H+-ATPase subunit I/STV1